MTVDTDKTIYVAFSDGDLHVLVPKGLRLNVEPLNLDDPDPDSNDGPIYRLAALEMDEHELPNPY